MFFRYLHYILYTTALLYFFLTWNSISKYRREHLRKAALLERCIPCNAEIIRPAVLDGSYTADMIVGAVDLLASLAGSSAHFGVSRDAVMCEVRYIVNGSLVQTMILRRAKIRQPKTGDSIAVLYDPKLPQHAFAEDMKDIMLNKPKRECILNAVSGIVCLFSGVFWHLNLI